MNWTKFVSVWLVELVIWMNDFELGPLVGQGAFGKVFKARKISTNQEVAIKVKNPKESFKPKKPKTFF